MVTRDSLRVVRSAGGGGSLESSAMLQVGPRLRKDRLDFTRLEHLDCSLIPEVLIRAEKEGQNRKNRFRIQGFQRLGKAVQNSAILKLESWKDSIAALWKRQQLATVDLLADRLAADP